MYCLDSNVCIEFLRGNMPNVLKLMRASGPQLFGVPTMVEAELLVGAAKSARPQENRLMVERLLAPMERFPFGSVAAHHYGRIRASLELQGMVIGPNELVIAATCLAEGAVLVTDNVREFMRVEGLQIESWAEVPL